MRLVIVLAFVLLSALAPAEERDDDRATERFWEILSLPYVRSIPEVRAMRRALIGAFFPRWPYRDGRDGYLKLEPLFRREPRLRLYGGHVDIEGGTDRHPEAAIGGDIDSTFHLGAIARLQRSWRREGDSTSGFATSAWRLFESRGVRLRAGAGLRGYADERWSGFGPLIDAHLELFPHHAWDLAFAGDLGSVGPHLVVSASAAAGLLERAVELQGGLRLQSGWPSFHGPFVALRYWF